jgi:hypothetical protein
LVIDPAEWTGGGLVAKLINTGSLEAVLDSGRLPDVPSLADFDAGKAAVGWKPVHGNQVSNTQGNQACSTQVTGEGSLLFLALLNDGLVNLIPLYFTAEVDVPLDYMQALRVGETQDEHVSIKHVPVAHCEHGPWTSCTDSLYWEGTLSITRTA